MCIHYVDIPTPEHSTHSLNDGTVNEYLIQFEFSWCGNKGVHLFTQQISVECQVCACIPLLFGYRAENKAENVPALTKLTFA